MIFLSKTSNRNHLFSLKNCFLLLSCFLFKNYHTHRSQVHKHFSQYSYVNFPSSLLKKYHKFSLDLSFVYIYLTYACIIDHNLSFQVKQLYNFWNSNNFIILVSAFFAQALILNLSQFNLSIDLVERSLIKFRLSHFLVVNFFHYVTVP